MHEQFRVGEVPIDIWLLSDNLYFFICIYHGARFIHNSVQGVSERVYVRCDTNIIGIIVIPRLLIIQRDWELVNPGYHNYQVWLMRTQVAHGDSCQDVVKRKYVLRELHSQACLGGTPSYKCEPPHSGL